MLQKYKVRRDVPRMSTGTPRLDMSHMDPYKLCEMNEAKVVAQINEDVYPVSPNHLTQIQCLSVPPQVYSEPH